jgi:anti-sigma28 factor (negative regulator of flagellin synthesis)
VTLALLEYDSSIDADELGTLKAAIACGAYRIDHDALAKAIIGFGRSTDCQKFDVAAPSGN